MNLGKKPSTHLHANDEIKLVDVAVYSFCDGIHLNCWFSLHCDTAGVDRSNLHSFFVSFMHQVSTWVHRNTGQPIRYLFVFENPTPGSAPGKHGGLNMHVLLHVPFSLWPRFSSLAKGSLVRSWLKQAGGTYKRKVIRFDRLRYADTSDADSYLRHGLLGTLLYVLKGLDPTAPNVLGVEREPQGVILGKRCGHSQSLSPSKRTWTPAKLKHLRVARAVFGYDMLSDAPLTTQAIEPDAGKP
jgi:hypothetical protein